MRILFSSLPATGHFRALIPIAQAARRRGHQVVIGTAESARERVRAYGLEHVRAGQDWAGERIRELASRTDLPPDHQDRVRNFLTTQGYPGEAALEKARDLLDLAGGWRPDLVVRENTDFGGYLAAEALGVAHVSVGVAGASREYLEVTRLAPALDEQRRALGLAADPTGERVYAYLHVNLTPAAYDPAELSIPNVRCYRQVNPEVPGERLPGWITELPADVPVVFAGFGTMYPLMAAWDSVTGAVIAGLGELPCSGIVAVGPNTGLGPVPANVRLVDHVAQPLLLEVCDLLITHGGFNSVREALRLGVPMVIIPWGTDQHANARRCRTAGIARVLDRDALTPAVLREACLDVLTDPGYAHSARRIQREYLTMATIDELVTDLEDLQGRTSSDSSVFSWEAHSLG